MKLGLVALLALVTGACTSGEAASFDGNDDLHCSVLMFHSVRVETPTTGGSMPKHFAMSAWYNKKIGNKPDLLKADPILKAAESNFGAAQQALQTCESRAENDSIFKAFEREAIKAWGQVENEGTTAK